MKFKTKLSKWLKNPTFSKEYIESLKERFDNPEEINVERRFFAPATEKGFEELKEGERAIIQYVSTRDLDRDKEILMPSGCDLSEFKKAPSVLWGHNYSLPPIGKDIWIQKDEKGIKAKTVYAETVRGEECWQLRKGGFLKTSSVGFIPLESTTPSCDDWEKTCNKLLVSWPEFAKIKDKVRRIIKKWLLLEHSDVSVPANINALTVAVAKGDIELGDDIRKELNVADPEYLKAILGIALKAKGEVDKINENDELNNGRNVVDEKAQEAINKELKNSEPWPDLKPLPNEHTCRRHNPSTYSEFRRIGRESDGKEYYAIIGKRKSDDTWEEQSCRYPKKDWTVENTKKHCNLKDVILFEPARESRSPLIIRPLPKQETPESRKTEIDKAVKDEFNRLKGKV